MLHSFDYPSKDQAVVGAPDRLIIGPAALVHEEGEDSGRLFPRLG